MARSRRLRVSSLAASASVCGLTALVLALPGSGAAAQPGPGMSPLPRTMTGQVIRPRSGTLARGTVLKPTTIFSNRIFSSAAHGFALATRNSADYPVLSTNGGHTWTIAGPALHVAAADAPAAVTSVGVRGPQVDYAYGSGTIDVTANGGGTWYQVFPEGNVTAVVAGARGLAAYVQALNAQTGAVSGIYQYISFDGGHHWTLSNELDG